jgi:ankyrin repeat protein
MLAGLLGRDNVIPLLLKAGADPTLVGKNLQPNFNGKTAYEMAVLKGQTKAADCLRSE